MSTSIRLILVATVLYLLSTPLNAQRADSPALSSGQPIAGPAASNEAMARIVVVPELLGRATNEAKQVARLAGLEFSGGVFYIAPRNWRDDIRPRSISMQTPQPDTLVPAGTRVGCWIFARANAQQKVVEMPDLQGLSMAEAAKKISELQLTLMNSALITPLALVGDQYPRAGQTVFAKTSVFLIHDLPARRNAVGDQLGTPELRAGH